MTNEEETTRNLKLPSGESLFEFSAKQDVLCILVRHNGCTFCRETLGELQKNLVSLQSLKLKIIVVHLGPSEDTEILKKTFGLDGVEVVSDPQQNFYKTLGARRARLNEVISPSIVWNGLKSGALLKYGIGKPEADIYQLGGIFLVSHGEVEKVHQPKNSADTFSWKPFLDSKA